MDIFEAIYQRRSVRRFTGDPVSEMDVRKILGAAMMAPSAGNAQPWQFVVVREKSALGRIRTINPYAAMAAEAPLGILVCGDLRLEKYEGFWVQDCAAAVENLLLAVQGLGLGGVWTGIYPMADRVQGFKELFSLPEAVIPLAFVVIGHPSHGGGAPDRYREDRIHYERW